MIKGQGRIPEQATGRMQGQPQPQVGGMQMGNPNQLPSQAAPQAQQNAFGMNPNAGSPMGGQLPPQANPMAQQNAFGRNPQGMAPQPSIDPGQVAPMAQDRAMNQEMQRRGLQSLPGQMPSGVGQGQPQGMQQGMQGQNYDQIMQILQRLFGNAQA